MDKTTESTGTEGKTTDSSEDTRLAIQATLVEDDPYENPCKEDPFEHLTFSSSSIAGQSKPSHDVDVTLFPRLQGEDESDEEEEEHQDQQLHPDKTAGQEAL